VIAGLVSSLELAWADQFAVVAVKERT